MDRVDLVFFDAGGGHRSAANALRDTALSLGKAWEVRLVQLQEVLEPLDVFRRLTGLRLESIYNQMLARGWTYGSSTMLSAMQWIIKLGHEAQVRVLAEHWRANPADVVVSLVPNMNRAMLAGLRQAAPQTPFVTVLTDIADYPPHFWMERQEQYLVCGSERARAQAEAMGHASHRIKTTSGMILRPSFHAPLVIDCAAERKALGLDVGAPTALLLFGGHGSPVMFEIARQLDDVQMIAICGHNSRLREKLTSLRRRAPIWVEGFTAQIPRFMKLADFMIGKPGPGSISEAVAMGLPVIVQVNSATLPQERYNALWVEELGLGLSFKSVCEIRARVEEMLEPTRLAQMRANALSRQNHAVYEVVEFLEEVMVHTPIESASQRA